MGCSTPPTSFPKLRAFYFPNDILALASETAPAPLLDLKLALAAGTIWVCIFLKLRPSRDKSVLRDECPEFVAREGYTALKIG